MGKADGIVEREP